MSATRVDDEESIGCSCHPDTVLLLPFCIDAESVVVWRADAKFAGRFENRARQEKPHEHQEESDQRARDGSPDDAASHFVHRRVGARLHDCGSRCCFCGSCGSRGRRRSTYTWGGQLIGLTIQVQTSVESIPNCQVLRTSVGYTSTLLTEGGYTISPSGIPLCAAKRIISLNMKSAAPNKTKYNYGRRRYLYLIYRLTGKKETMKPHVIIYSRPGCHLCEEAKAAIQQSGCTNEFTLEEINIESDTELLRKYKYDIPVIAIDGHESFIHRVDPKEFRTRITRIKSGFNPR